MNWIKLTEVYGRLQAELIQSLLNANGIDVELIQEAIGHYAYPTTVDGLALVQIFVSRNNQKIAESILSDHGHSFGSYENKNDENETGEE